MTQLLDGYEDEEALAAEFVLGLLSENEVEDVEERIANDANFRGEVLAWRKMFSAMASGVASENPPARVRRTLDEKLFDADGRSASYWSGFVIGVFTALAIVSSTLILFFRP